MIFFFFFFWGGGWNPLQGRAKRLVCGDRVYTVRTGPSVRIILLPFVYIVMCSSAILSIVCHFGWLSVLYLCIRILVRFFVCRCFRNKHLATTTEHNL